MPAHSRRAALAAVLFAVGAMHGADAKKKKKRRKYRCRSGPCNYASCLTYVDAEGAKLTPNLANQAAIRSAKEYCCGSCSSLGCSSGKAFHDKAVSCVAAWLG